ncbi:MAG: anthranilate phosphoribosyltransferase [Dehalococcoidia bacterium]|nr:anthranilate phosphoribosyltransferase [Dehalococcoidia bacterium]
MIREAIATVVSGKSLSMEEAAQVMNEIMSGETTPAQFGAFVVALRMKGETVEEIAGLAKGMREKATPLRVKGPLVDTAGTGGDARGTFNISTTTAFVVAGAGLSVAKHGNRAISSRCGSADVLECLGVKIDMDARLMARCLQEVGIGFLFAPQYHPAMKYAAAPRREVGIWTVFNILGPLTNPAGARYQVIGVANPSLTFKLAHALQLLGCEHALVVHGEDGLDEMSIGARTTICEVNRGSFQTYFTTPEELGLQRAPLDVVKGGTVQENAEVLLAVLRGETGPRRDIVLLNAAAALVAGNKAEDLKQGIQIAADSLDRGAALAKLDELVAFCHRLEVSP